MEFEFFFPDLVKDMKVYEYYIKLIQRTKLLAQRIQGIKIDEEKLAILNKELLLMFEPGKYLGPGGMEIEVTKSFEEACYNISTLTSRDPKKMTVLEYYQAIEIIKEQNKKSGKSDFNI